MHLPVNLCGLHPIAQKLNLRKEKSSLSYTVLQDSPDIIRNYILNNLQLLWKIINCEKYFP